MIHPAFEDVPDPYLAEVFSEAVSDDYQTFGSDLRPAEPTPMVIRCVFANFLSDLPGGFVKEQPVMVAIGDDVSAEDASRVYSETTPLARLVAEKVTGIDAVGKQLLQERYAKLVLENGNRLLAAHIVGRLVSSDELVGVMAFSKRHSDFGLSLREKVLKADDQGISNADLAILPLGYEEVFRRVRTNDPAISLASLSVGASFLPSEEQFVKYTAQVFV